MFFFKLSLYIIAYSAGIIRLALAIYIAAKTRKKGSFWKISFLVVFAVLIVSLSNLETLSELKLGGIYFFGIIAAYCSAFLTLTIPLFVHSEIADLSHIHLRNSIFVSLSSISIALITVHFFIPVPNIYFIMLLISVSVMSATIIYSMTMALLAIKRKTNKATPNTAEKILPAAVIVLIPVMIWVDFLKNLADGFIIVPVLYLLINILMILGEIRLLHNPRGDIEISSEKMDSLGLTSREQEIVRRLLKGLTYGQTADKLYISVQTVKTHATRIYTKTATQNKLGLLNKISS